MDGELLPTQEPVDYFAGVGIDPLPTPLRVLLFSRFSKRTLQQEALQNRSHHRFVLVVNLEAKGHVHLDSQARKLCPGQGLLIFPYQFHHFSHLEATRLRWLFCTFEMDPSAILEPLRNRVIDQTEKSSQLLECLLHEWKQQRPETIQPALQSLLMELRKECMDSASGYQPEPSQDLLRAIHRHLVEWRGRPMTVGDLARETNYSESRLRVLFKEVAGIPLGRYIQNYRLNRAMALLRTTKNPIADVAEEAGFGSAQAFCRVFKHEMGMTPRAYRDR